MTSPPSDVQANTELAVYGASDAQTRKLIELQLQRNHWSVRQQILLQWTGLMLGFVTTLAFLGVSAWLINGNHDTAGTVMGTVDLVALVTVFVVGRRIENPQPTA